jgi:hypothetical protein
MTAWDDVVAATEGHNIADVRVVIGEKRPWVYIECSCNADTFTEQWEYTDHIRRIVFAAIMGSPS